jgi:hypothetical protein
MNWLGELFRSEGVLRWVQIALLVSGLTFSMSYLIPRGMQSYQAWKEKKKKTDLSSAVGNVCTGVFILLYLLGALLIQLARG